MSAPAAPPKGGLDVATIEQRFPALNDHLLRMASTGTTGSLSEWGDFFNILREALAAAPAPDGMRERDIAVVVCQWVMDDVGLAAQMSLTPVATDKLVKRLAALLAGGEGR